jgi:hypothetical protein
MLLIITVFPLDSIGRTVKSPHGTFWTLVSPGQISSTTFQRALAQVPPSPRISKIHWIDYPLGGAKPCLGHSLPANEKPVNFSKEGARWKEDALRYRSKSPTSLSHWILMSGNRNRTWDLTVNSGIAISGKKICNGLYWCLSNEFLRFLHQAQP